MCSEPPILLKVQEKVSSYKIEYVPFQVKSIQGYYENKERNHVFKDNEDMPERWPQKTLIYYLKMSQLTFGKRYGT